MRSANFLKIKYIIFLTILYKRQVKMEVIFNKPQEIIENNYKYSSCKQNEFISISNIGTKCLYNYE